MYRNGSLGDDRTSVHFGAHEVYGATVDAGTRRQGALMGIETFERWQQ